MIALIYLIMLVVQVTFYLIPTQLPFYTRDDLGTDNTTLVGFAMAVGTGASAIASLGSRRFRDRVARRSGADELTTGGYLRVLGMALGLMAVSNVVIAMATGIEGLDVTHTGFVYRTPEGGTGFIHASLTGEVKVSDDLAGYVEDNAQQIGIIVARPVPPGQ